MKIIHWELDSSCIKPLLLQSCQSIVIVKNDYDVNLVTIQIPHK